MEKEKFKELIIGHKERFLGRRDLVPREVQTEIARFLLQREIILLTGVRRSGKSSLLRLIYGDLLAQSDVTPADVLYMRYRWLLFSFFLPAGSGGRQGKSPLK